MRPSLDYPRLRPLDNEWIERGGRPALVLRDRLALNRHAVVLTPELALILSLCDGTRDLASLGAAFEQRAGLSIKADRLSDIIAQFDEALLLDSPRLAAAVGAALDDYRASPQRAMSLAGLTYPADAASCGTALRGYAAEARLAKVDGTANGSSHGLVGASDGEIRAVISPHIDYQRGGPVYASVWERAAAAARSAEIAVVFGTDHVGGAGQITLTRIPYTTPFGILPVAADVVNAVARAIGEEQAFAEELHHRNEHSIELAAVWLHHARDGRPIPMVPILCGSFHRYVDGVASAASERHFSAALGALRQSIGDRRLLVVAAADLAHVGPAFGDEGPFGETERADLEATDTLVLEAACGGDPERFLAEIAAEGDRFRICGLPPIYLALRLAGIRRGEVVAYEHCPADDSGSWVSVAGVVLE